jgi:hypothetical protein
VRPVKPKKEEEDEQMEEVAFEDCQDFGLFLGSGTRLDGKSSGTLETPSTVVVPRRRGVRDFDYEYGTIQFFSNAKFNNASSAENNTEVFKPFRWPGMALKTKSSTK